MVDVFVMYDVCLSTFFILIICHASIQSVKLSLWIMHELFIQLLQKNRTNKCSQELTIVITVNFVVNQGLDNIIACGCISEARYKSWFTTNPNRHLIVLNNWVQLVLFVRKKTYW